MSRLFQLGKTLTRISSASSSCGGQVCFSSSSFPVKGGGEEPWIPPYEQRQGEPVEVIRARLLYQSRKRGMLENGILLSTFAAKYLDSMAEAELKEYDRLINLPSNDWDIYYWATGVKPIPPEFDTPVLQKFVLHVRNTEKEQRFKQPDLYCKE